MSFRLLVICFVNNIFYVSCSVYYFVGVYTQKWHLFLMTLGALHTTATNDLLLLLFSTPLRDEFCAVVKRMFSCEEEEQQQGRNAKAVANANTKIDTTAPKKNATSRV